MVERPYGLTVGRKASPIDLALGLTLSLRKKRHSGGSGTGAKSPKTDFAPFQITHQTKPILTYHYSLVIWNLNISEQQKT